VAAWQKPENRNLKPTEYPRRAFKLAAASGRLRVRVRGRAAGASWARPEWMPGMPYRPCGPAAQTDPRESRVTVLVIRRRPLMSGQLGRFARRQAQAKERWSPGVPATSTESRKPCRQHEAINN
jgi:hypothetical protein